MRSLANRIKSIRLSLKMNQSKFAKCLGVSQSTVSRWEIDDDVPTDNNLQAIIDLLASTTGGASRYSSISELRYGGLDNLFPDDSVFLFDLPTIANKGFEIITSDEAAKKQSKGKVDVIYRSGERLVAIEMPDDSMQRFAPRGSWLVVDVEDTQVLDGELGVFVVEFAANLRKAMFRILRTSGPLRLEPSNPESGTETIYLDSEPVVFGRAVKTQFALPRKAG